MTQALELLINCVRSAQGCLAPMRICGGDTKHFYGEQCHGTVLDTRALQGICAYEPTELVITARAGTSLAELEDTLAAKGQYLPFEPPRFALGGLAGGGTVGGMVAAGLCGPARASVGSVRDHVLGVTVLNGHAEVLTFGGQVIKNVAGFDVSRMFAGSLGTLGVILEVSLKVMPLPVASATVRIEMPQAQALQHLNLWAGTPLPLNASAWHQDLLSLRLSGARAAVQSAVKQLQASHGATVLDTDIAQTFWCGLRDHQNPFFNLADPRPLWRLAVPSTTPPIPTPSTPEGAPTPTLIEWGGAQRWWRTLAPASEIRALAKQAQGHATLFRCPNDMARVDVFTPLEAPVAKIHHALKKSFDPNALFNPGRMYPGL